mmetsp:Transcript_6876/g.12614  ORF Transcript_6876/g.12614 Transcript_6876/m.12614 type:complete len:240 (+) Transcript_6876:62-781(+)
MTSVYVNEPSVGMMNEAYFKSRGELLAWVNDLLGLHISKVEECATGAFHCQIIDAIYPRRIKMSKVNFGARYDHEYTANFKVLQDAFTKLGVKKIVPVQKLVKAKYQDNLEFLQWMYQFFQANYNGEEYNAEERRSKSKGVAKMKKMKENSSGALNRPKKTYSKPVSYSRKSSTEGKKLAEYKKKCEEYERNMKIVLKERDFYFQKIVEIEKICIMEEFKDTKLSETLCKVMYDEEEKS